MDACKPAAKSDHNTAKFRIAGLHQKVECGKCHKKDAVELSILPVCSMRHAPHVTAIPMKAGSSKRVRVATRLTDGDRLPRQFSHATTRFPLSAAMRR